MRLGLSRLINLFAETAQSVERDRRARADSYPIAGDEAWGYDSFSWEGYPDFKLPPRCPVIPLGVLGDVAYFVDPLGQVLASPASSRRDQQLFDLFKGRSNFVHHHWPGRAKVEIKGETQYVPTYHKIEARQAWNCLINAASRKGIFDPSERMRGRGGWVVGAGRELFLWHAGDAIFMASDGLLREAEPGDIDDKFYAAGPPLIEPWKARVADDANPAPAILKHLQTWRYKRQDLDPVLLLGAIACAFYGGALDQRPVTLLTGDRGQGKSSMQAFVKSIMGSLLIDAANTTAAGIYQRLKRDSLAVWVDEFEGSARGDGRTAPIVELARQAYSGALALRGGADHQGTQFQLSSAFFFSAINPPAMEAADYSRMAIINLQRLDIGVDPPVFDLDPREVGRMLLRKLMDDWGVFRGYLAQWRQAFRRSGLDARFCDTFGTFLAGAHVLLGDIGMEDAGIPVTASAEIIGGWVQAATAHERSLIVDNWRACFEYLLAQTIEDWGGTKKVSIGAVLRGYERAVGDSDEEGENYDLSSARQRLEAAGMGLVDLVGGRADKVWQACRARAGWMDIHPHDRRPYLLAVPFDHPALNRMFAGSKWQGGGWRTALQQAPPHVALGGPGIPEVAKIARVAKRAIMLDLRGYDFEVRGQGGGDGEDG